MRASRRGFLLAAGSTALAGCLTDNSDEYEQRLAAQNETIDTLESELEDKRQIIDDLESEIDVLQRDIESERAALQSELEATEAELANATARHDALEAKVDHLEQTIDELEPEATFSDVDIEAARELGAAVRESVLFAWDRHGYATAFEISPRHFLSVEHGLEGKTGGPWGETIDGNSFDLTNLEVVSGNDLRLLHGEESTGGSIDVTNYRMPEQDEPIALVGHPQNVADWAVSLGRYVETRNTNAIDADHLVVSAPGTQGNSGGPAFTLDGDFVGMVTHTKTWRDIEIADPDPYFHFAAYQPYLGCLPAEKIVEYCEDWGAIPT